MKEFTMIWLDSWMSGSHRHTNAKKNFVLAPDVKTVMESKYGSSIQYLFEGYQCTIGEEVNPDEVIIMPEPIQLALCEQGHLILKPDVTYIFKAVAGCKKCEEYLEDYKS